MIIVVPTNPGKVSVVFFIEIYVDQIPPMKYVLLSAFLLSSFAASSQSSGLDASFGTKGIFRTNGHTIPGQTRIHVLPDDKILMAYTEVHPQTLKNNIFVKRLLPDGKPDLSFATGGTASFTYGSYEEAIDVRATANGKVLLTIAPLTYQDNQYSILRLNTNGTPDSSFNDSGVVHITYPNIMTLTSVATQPDGKILLAGGPLQGVALYYYVLRHNENGTVDTAFGNKGTIMLPVMRPACYAHALVMQPDGKALVAGTSFSGMHGSQFRREIVVARFDDNGLDGTFGNGSGYSSIEVPDAYTLSLSSMVRNTSGDIFLSGNINYRYEGAAYSWVAKMKADGSGLDSAFGINGTLELDSIRVDFRVLPKLALQQDGKLLLSYGEQSGQTILRHTLRRLLPDGTPDLTFFHAGKLSATIIPDQNTATDIDLQSDGKILLAGRHYNTQTTQGSYIARYWHNQSLDVTTTPEAKQVSIYPNPVSAELNITGLEKGTTIQLINVYGRKMYESIAEFAQQAIDMRGLPTGTYFLSLKKGDSQHVETVIRL